MTSFLEQREEQARREVGRTDVARPVAVLLVVAFLLTIASGVGVQMLMPSAGTSGRAGLGEDFGRFASQATEAFDVAAEDGFFAGNRATHRAIDDLEIAVEEASWMRAAVRPGVQLLLSGSLGVGNEQVYLGPGGRLWFRPGFDYVTGPPFLDSAVLARRASGGDEWRAPPHSDPRSVIEAWTAALGARGIRLVLVPTPGKVSIEAVAGRVLQNPSYAELIETARRAGAEVFDPAPLLAAFAKDGEPAYLHADTHWRPEVVERVATELAREIERLVELAPVSRTYRRQAAVVSNRGDLFDLLGLPESQQLVPLEEVEIRRVVDVQRRLWRSDPAAEVLLLGDSFSNVYSMSELGWGEGAGLAEQLAASLGRPIDKIAVNAGGAFGARERLVTELAEGRDRLAGKKIVIWQFAQRELAVGDWKPLPLPDEESK
jgi:alginate O-acetyltransferase complex protein AlgJ